MHMEARCKLDGNALLLREIISKSVYMICLSTRSRVESSDSRLEMKLSDEFVLSNSRPIRKSSLRAT